MVIGTVVSAVIRKLPKGIKAALSSLQDIILAMHNKIMYVYHVHYIKRNYCTCTVGIL